MHDRLSFLLAFAQAIDRINEWLGRAVSWLTLAMVIVSCVVLILRYAVDWGAVWLQESVVWMHGILFLAAAGYTLRHNDHVRIDVIYRQRSGRYRSAVNLLGSLLLLLPMLFAIAWASWPYVAGSWSTMEASREAGGLAGVFVLKSFLLVFCVTLALQGLSLAATSLVTLAAPPNGNRRRGGLA